MSNDYEQTYRQLCEHTRETALFASVQGLLCWDERTMLPQEGGEFRSQQVACLAGHVHRRQTDPRIGEWLAVLSDSPLADEPYGETGATIRKLKRRYEKNTKLPQTLVEELAAAEISGQRAWAEARKNDDYAAFAPELEKIVDLCRRKADAYGYESCRYDALLDDYEPGMKTAKVAVVLERLRNELVPLVAEIAASPRRPDKSILTRRYPVEIQEVFGRQAAAAIGFDFDSGRLDVTDHPFCSEIAPGDCRITTRYDDHFFPGAFFGILHEAGHGIYEQGLRRGHFGLPPGEAVSLGIHESQSRLWENMVGRSPAFWRHWYPAAQAAFPEALGETTVDAFLFAINAVEPSLIRVEADEATYNLHIIVRFELEQALLDGDLSISDLPAAWNDKYEQCLGIRPSSDTNGVLQDIHWSGAAIGYFSTYTLGNLCAAQFFEKAENEIGPLAGQFAEGDYSTLLGWLRERIHHPGSCLPPDKLVERVTGQPLSHEPLMRYLRDKFTPLYDLA